MRLFTVVSIYTLPTQSIHFIDIPYQCNTMQQVSAATFRPVTATMVSDHDMHAERFEIRSDESILLTTNHTLKII